jgi:DNA repair exonuclease SbcCD ATPase subunit
VKLRSLTLAGFRSYGEPTTITFPDGLSAIVGANGAGKSSILEAVMWCLYGARSKLDNGDLLRTGSEQMSVTVEFEHRGTLFRAGRDWKHGGRQSQLILLCWSSSPRARNSSSSRSREKGPGEDLTQSTIAETQRVIAGIVGSYDVAIATWYVGQDKGSAFLEALPFERRQILGESLGLGTRWEAIHKAARTAVAESERECHASTAVLEALDVTANTVDAATGAHAAAQREAVAAKVAVETATARLGGLTAQVVALEKQQAEHRATWKVAAGAENLVMGCESRVDAIDSGITANAALLADEAEITAAVEAHTAAMVEYDTYRERWEFAHGLWEQRTRAKHNADGLRSRIVGLTATTCPTCGQDLHGEGQAKVAALHDAAIAELKGLIPLTEPGREPPRPERPSASPLVEREAGLANARQARTRLQAARDEAQRTLTEAQEAHKTAQEAVTAPAEWGTVRKDAHNAGVRLANERQDSTNAQAAEGVAAHALQALTDAFKRKTALQNSLADLEATLEIQRLVAECAAPAGARQLILDSALPRIETAANELLAILRPGTTVHFETQRAESERETLDVSVLDESGYRKWQSFSGGERTRIMFATRVAMSIAAADAHGLGSLPLFVFDESFGNQDEGGRQALVRSLSVLSGQVQQVIAVTHDVGLIDGIDQALKVTRQGTQSRVTWTN